ncbi:MAG: hypothetical protein ABIG61_08680 [Planctomycetota bacterium]
MNDEKKHDELLTTTDSLEAIGAFRAMKNFLFIVILLCLLLLQGLFWVVNLGLTTATEQKSTSPAQSAVSTGSDGAEPASAAVKQSAPEEKQSDIGAKAEAEKEDISAAAQKATQQLSEPNVIVVVEKQNITASVLQKIFPLKFAYIAGLIKLFNYVIIIAAGVYSLTLMFSLKLSLVARFGGINHICRAFFLSLFLLAFLLPWQCVFGRIITGAIYTPDELLRWCPACGPGVSLFCKALLYLRFIALWLLVALLAIFAQIRSSRWAKATLRRLEVM